MHFSSRSHVDGHGVDTSPVSAPINARGGAVLRASATTSKSGSNFQSSSMTRSSSVSISIGRPHQRDGEESVEDSHQRRYGVSVQSATPKNSGGLGGPAIEPPVVPRALYERIVRTQDLTVPTSHISTTRVRSDGGGTSREHFHIDRRPRVLPPPPPPLTPQAVTPTLPPEPEPNSILKPENADYLEALDRMARSGRLGSGGQLTARRELLRPVVARQKDLSLDKLDLNYEIHLKREIERQLSTRRAQWQEALQRGDAVSDEKPPLKSASQNSQADTKNQKRSPITLPPLTTRTRRTSSSSTVILNPEAAPIDNFELQRRFRMAQKRTSQKRDSSTTLSQTNPAADDSSSNIEILDVDKGSGELYLRRPYVYKLSALPAVAGQYSVDGGSTTEGVGVAREGLVSEADLLGRDEQRAEVYRRTVRDANFGLLQTREGMARARAYAMPWPSNRTGTTGLRTADADDMYISQDPDIRRRQLFERACRTIEPGREEFSLNNL